MPEPSKPILLADDEPRALRAMEMTLRSIGLDNIKCFVSGTEVVDFVASEEPEMIVLDLLMPDMSGEESLVKIKKVYPDVPVMMATGVNDVETAVRCLKKGAIDYVLKPLERERFISGIKHACEIGDLRRENRALTDCFFARSLENPSIFEKIITRNERVLAVFKYIEAIASSKHPVLVFGETGVGKELVARAIHDASGRPGKFVAVNTAGIDDTVFSDTLFGHTKGAFTGAVQSRGGLVEQATNGTLFLDEIGDLKPETQIKLLRLLQEREYFPLGSDVPRSSSARIVTATCRNLDSLKACEKFRHDLFYRLTTHRVHMPPLRERKEDIELLVQSFLQQGAMELGKSIPTVPPELFDLLGTYFFPGNIRELQAMVYDALSLHDSRMMSMQLFKERIAESEAQSLSSDVESPLTINFPQKLPTFRQIEEQLVDEALLRSGGNQTIAAGLLGVTRQALSHRIRKKNRK